MKTKALMISRSRMLAHIFPNLVLDGTVDDRVTELKVLGVVLDTNLPFEGHSRLMAASAFSKLAIMRKALCLFSDLVLVLRCFWSFLLPVLEYCSPVWISTTASHLGLLDRVVSKRLIQTSYRCSLHVLQDLL